MHTTATTTRPAGIGTCLWAGHTFRADERPAATFTDCPTCPPVTMGGREQRSTVKWATLKTRTTKTACGSECLSAKSERCACECGGDNHGAAHGRAW